MRVLVRPGRTCPEEDGMLLMANQLRGPVALQRLCRVEEHRYPPRPTQTADRFFRREFRSILTPDAQESSYVTKRRSPLAGSGDPTWHRVRWHHLRKRQIFTGEASSPGLTASSFAGLALPVDENPYQPQRSRSKTLETKTSPKWSCPPQLRGALLDRQHQGAVGDVAVPLFV